MSGRSWCSLCDDYGHGAEDHLVKQLYPIAREDVEYGIMVDCIKNKCEEKRGSLHGDHGIISFRAPSREQVEEYRIDGEFWSNNHLCTLVYRVIPEWKVVERF